LVQHHNEFVIPSRWFHGPKTTVDESLEFYQEIKINALEEIDQSVFE
jgi:hypothetical protein